MVENIGEEVRKVGIDGRDAMKEIRIKMLSSPPRATQRPCEIYVDMD